MITVRHYREGDLSGIAALQQYVDEEMRSPPSEFEALWRWMYARNPFGPQHVVVAENELGEIVGHEGIMPYQLSFDGTTRRGGITGNLIVKEELRGTLLFPRLVRGLVKGLGPAGYEFGYGPVRPKMFASMLALGYRDMGMLPVYVRPYDAAKIAERFVRQPALRAILRPVLAAAQSLANLLVRPKASRVSVRRIQRFGDAHRSFLERCCAQFPIHAVRSPETLNWRYFEAPNRQYQVYEAADHDGPIGYVALRRMPMLSLDALGIVDILYPLHDPSIAGALLSAVHDEAIAENVSAVSCMLNEGNPVTPHLLRAGFLKAPEGFNMIVYEPKGKEPMFHPGTLKRWYVTWFDHDYV